MPQFLASTREIIRHSAYHGLLGGSDEQKQVSFSAHTWSGLWLVLPPAHTPPPPEIRKVRGGPRWRLRALPVLSTECWPRVSGTGSSESPGLGRGWRQSGPDRVGGGAATSARSPARCPASSSEFSLPALTFYEWPLPGLGCDPSPQGWEQPVLARGSQTQSDLPLQAGLGKGSAVPPASAGAGQGVQCGQAAPF